MKEPEGASRAVSDWIPDARLDAPAPAEAQLVEPVAERTPSERGRARPRSRRSRAITAAMVGGATIGGIVIGLLASGGGTGGDTGVSEGSLSVEQVGGALRPDEARAPIVARLTSLDIPEASLLAAAARPRDERGDARLGRGEDVAGQSSLGLLPIDSGDRYRYLRRVGAVAVVLAELGELAAQATAGGSADVVAAGARATVDRLSLIIARMNLSPYLRSQRLSTLVTIAIVQLSLLAAGDLDPGGSARLRRLSERLGTLGRSLVADLERASAAASAGDARTARKWLTEADRTLGQLATRQ